MFFGAASSLGDSLGTDRKELAQPVSCHGKCASAVSPTYGLWKRRLSLKWQQNEKVAVKGVENQVMQENKRALQGEILGQRTDVSMIGNRVGLGSHISRQV